MEGVEGARVATVTTEAVFIREGQRGSGRTRGRGRGSEARILTGTCLSGEDAPSDNARMCRDVSYSWDADGHEEIDSKHSSGDADWGCRLRRRGFGVECGKSRS